MGSNYNELRDINDNHVFVEPPGGVPLKEAWNELTENYSEESFIKAINGASVMKLRSEGLMGRQLQMKVGLIVQSWRATFPRTGGILETRDTDFVSREAVLGNSGKKWLKALFDYLKIGFGSLLSWGTLKAATGGRFKTGQCYCYPLLPFSFSV